MERKMTGGKIVDRSRGEPLREVSQPQVVDARKESVPITWNSPALHGGSPVKGYVIEKRKKGSSLCFPVTEEPVQVPPGLPEMVDFSNSNILLAWLEPDQEDVMSGYILEM
ncbi:hypothetical protein AAES_27169 [Amazona aestiva]|uniref:Fibronectin type-III domain-containing protein n=1 Tax=Amazona aestiva TaxID=12930 RepID=A0A0Q3TZZ5_AMAAE|nr:hypothetical protein AAES_27169 [Amazona aestiva]